MQFILFQQKAKNYPLFKTADVFKWFPKETSAGVFNQLNLWHKKGYIRRIRRGVYRLSDFEIKDAFVLASFLYGPSYVSLESALSAYSIIPDVPLAVTSVTTLKTKTFRAEDHGTFYYNHVKTELFFGFNSVRYDDSYSYRVAKPEKALLDFLYLRTRGVENAGDFVDGLRLEIDANFNFREFKKWSELVDKKHKIFHETAGVIAKKYGHK